MLSDKFGFFSSCKLSFQTIPLFQRFLGFYSLYSFCISSIMMISSYKFNRFYNFVLNVNFQFQALSFILSNSISMFCLSLLINISQLIIFCSDAFFQPKIFLFLSHWGKSVTTNIRIYQCFRCFFFLCYLICFWLTK